MNINYFDIEHGVVGFTQKHYQLKRHAHFPIEVAFALSGSLHITTDDQAFTRVQSVIIHSNVPHTFSCVRSECQLYFIEPGSNTGKNILKQFFNGRKETVLIDVVEKEHFKEDFIDAFQHQQSRPGAMDKRIQRCLDWIKQNYSTEGINISMIAEIVFLSEGRLAHLFKEQVGISVHQYILWKKIEMAVKHGMEGFSLTECAYHAGFADSSHFIKTFQKMFGIYPSFAFKK